MKRIPEKEIMNDQENANAYASANFDEVNRNFVKGLFKKLDIPEYSKILDLGTGPAKIPILIHQKRPDLSITALDGSAAMLQAAQNNLAIQNINTHIKLVQGYLPGLAEKEHSFDLVISNSLLHHLPEPKALWNEINRLAKPKAKVYIMDLLRPNSKEEAQKLVETYSNDEPEVLKKDFYHSLLAAFTIDEIHEQLKKTCLKGLQVEKVSDRHWLVYGEI